MNSHRVAWYNNMAPVSLFCNTNMAAVCRHVHRLYVLCTLLWCCLLFIVKNHYYLTVRFTKLLTNGFRSSFEIPEVRNYIVNLEMKL